MDPATRNRILMIGGGLIIVALFLVCGPMQGQFGQGTSEPPSVAAAPPPVVIPEPVVEVIEPEIDRSAELAAAQALLDAQPTPAVEVKPPVAVGKIQEVVKAPAPKTRRAAPKPLPAVSAAPVPLLPAGPSPAELEAQAKNLFDSVSPAAFSGTPMARFAPPVDSGPLGSSMASSSFNGFGGGSGMTITPCASPGAGCSNTVGPVAARILPAPGGGR